MEWGVLFALIVVEKPQHSRLYWQDFLGCSSFLSTRDVETRCSAFPKQFSAPRSSPLFPLQMKSGPAPMSYGTAEERSSRSTTKLSSSSAAS